jgi:O-antigen ligase
VLIGCIACFLLSRSATPIVAGVAALIVLCLGYLFQKSAGLVQAVVPAIICVTVAVVTIFGSDIAAAGADMLGRDTSFSGRTNIWEFVLGMIAERPWIGYGYGIFWLGLDAPGAVFWYWTKQFELHAHDGYLQLVLDAGLVGLLLLLSSIATLIGRTFVLAKSGQQHLAIFLAMFLTYYLVSSISESVLWQPNGLLVVLYAWLTVRAGVAMAQRRIPGHIASRQPSAFAIPQAVSVR